MSPNPTPTSSNTTIAPFSLVFAATISGPMPKFNTTCSAIFSIDDAGPITHLDEIEDEELSDKPFWED